MELRELSVDDLVLDEKLNLRDQLDQDAIERYDDAWDRLPPVAVFEINDRFLIVDGFHRYASALRGKRQKLRVEVHVGSMADAMDYAALANLRHGLPLSRAERRRVAETRLRLHFDWSDRKHADESALNRDLFARVRKELEAAGQIPANSKRVGADGKTYPSAGLPRDPNEHLPRDRAGGGPDDPRDRGRSEADAPWEDANDFMPIAERVAAGGSSPSIASAPWDDATAKAVALSPPVAVAESSIQETVRHFTDQICDLIGWVESQDFADSYRTASRGVRSRFEDAGLRLADAIKHLQLSK